MNAVWDSVLHVLDTMPHWLAAVLVGWAISVGLTQGLKFTIPVKWCPSGRELTARLVAASSAGFPAGLYYASEPDAKPSIAALVIIGAAVWSPLAFALLQAVLRRYFPWLADALSADKRGVVMSKIRGQS